MKNLMLGLLVILGLFSCQNRSEAGYQMGSDKSYASSSVESTEEYDDQESEPSGSQSGDDTNTADRKIIKTADIRAEVEDVKASSAKVEAKVKAYQGFISNVNYSNSYHEMQADFSIRVPYDQFDALMNDLGEEALYVEYKNISANDVTEEYRDVETRLATKKTVRDRYVDILKNKAKTVEEVLMAEETIRTIQEEIESKEGRLRYLKSQVSLSTINLNIYQNVSGPVAKQPSFFKNIGRAFENGWEVFLDLLIGLVSIWPILLVMSLGFYLLRRFWWRSRK